MPSTIFQNSCVICLTKNAKYSLLNLKLDNIMIFKLIEEVLPVFEKLTSACLPQKICEECHNHLLIFGHLKHKCEISNKVFLKILEEHEQNDLDNKHSLHKVFNILSCPLYNEIHLTEENSCENNSELSVEDDVNTSNKQTVSSQKNAKQEVIKMDQDFYNTAGQIVISKRENQLKDDRVIKCNKCSKVFKSLAGLAYHKNTHEGDNILKCDVCNKTFYAQKNLYIHKRRHISEYKFLCSKCGKRFLTYTEFSRHSRSHNMSEKFYKCDICPKTFTTNISLSQHKLRHLGEKPHVCDVCAKRFTTTANLNEHKLSHLLEKPHKCEICGNSWISTSDLKKHMRTHSGEKPFVCETCGKTFGRSGTLKIHQRIHSGVKPYECNVCRKKFGHLSSLTKHCKICPVK